MMKRIAGLVLFVIGLAGMLYGLVALTPSTFTILLGFEIVSFFVLLAGAALLTGA